MVQVTGGRVSGIRDGQLLAWRGIPYAAPPLGTLRWRAPAPVLPWDGVRDGSAFGPVAPQPARPRVGRGASPHLGAEDCLTVNVHAPIDIAPDDRLPVMVFIHGGGYYQGSSADFAGQGEGFAGTGRVVFVSFNYRLGPLGYLDFGAYSTPERPIDGNLGLRDQVAALNWVHENIAAMGGDPDRITVFGESAGGNAVTTLLAVPAARGLFAQAIAQSAPANAVYPAELAARWASEFLGILQGGVPGGSPVVPGAPARPEESRPTGRLLAASVAELLAAAHVLQQRTPEAYPGAYCFAPVVDGDFLPEPPIDSIRRGRAVPVPLVIGTNEREGTVFRGRMDILPGTATRIEALFRLAPSGTGQVMRRAYPGLPRWRAAADFGGDYGFWYPSTRVADFHSRHAPVHAYRFDLAPRLLRLVGLDATHGVEMLTLFDRTDVPLARTITSLGGREPYARAGDRMRHEWIRFAESGTTSGAWPAYTEQDRATLIIDDEDRIERDPHQDRRIAWDGFLPRLGNPTTATGPETGSAG
ncbi:carboxylesterase/lipase family protein [Arthrobacter sp. JSM 101049]|uniref:carboxylesterase/lipase family protein n=1 Tax=Arthrobacter sp. JSM 101049 TaxID=929097 RepID=UPI003569F9A9